MSGMPEVRLELCQQDCLTGIGESPKLDVSIAFLTFLSRIIEIGGEASAGTRRQELGEGFCISLRGERITRATRVTIEAPENVPDMKFELPRCFGSMLEESCADTDDRSVAHVQGGCAYALVELRTALDRHYPKLLEALDTGSILLRDE